MQNYRAFLWYDRQNRVWVKCSVPTFCLKENVQSWNYPIKVENRWLQQLGHMTGIYFIDQYILFAHIIKIENLSDHFTSLVVQVSLWKFQAHSMAKSCKNYGLCLKPLLFRGAEVDVGAHFTFKLFLQDGSLGKSFSYISQSVLEFKKKLFTGSVHK